jgi:uncharacterized membrane protein HdeD (DUF308 family)
MEQSKKHDRGRIIVGAAFILVGAIMLLSRIAGAPIGRQFWPFLLIIGGLMFYASYFLGRRFHGSEGLLFPGTYLTILGILFVILNITDWDNMRYLWPTFVFGVAVSLGAMYIFTPSDSAEQRKGLRSGIVTLSIISAALYLLAAKATLLWPLILIALGLVVIFSGFRKGADQKPEN